LYTKLELTKNDIPDQIHKAQVTYIHTRAGVLTIFSREPELSPVSIQTQSLALRALRKRKPLETQALALASSQSWLSLLRPSIPIGWRLRLLRENFTQQTSP